jgi:UDP-glucose:(heptosyl)LPS alpha-1,3-glucosyltransferase
MQHVVLLKSRSGVHGGLEKFSARMADAFRQRGASVTVLSAKPSSWPGFIRLEQFDRFVQNWLKKNHADIVFGLDRNRYQTHIRAGNGVHAAYLESRARSEGSLKKILSQINPLHRKILALEKCGFEYSGLRKLFTNSQMVQRQILERYSVDPAKIQVIHNGVEWHEMEAPFADWQKGRAAAFQKWGLDPHRFHFLFIGHGYARKGLDPLLIGLSRLKFRDFSLSVVGKDKQLDFYRAKAVRLGLKDHVHFFGPSQEILSFYQLADVLVIPSFYDPFANVTIEALAMGLFVLSSQSNGGHEILTPQNGLVIDNLFDPDAMVHALEESLFHKKTDFSAHANRQSVQYLDFSHQMRLFVDAVYE